MPRYVDAEKAHIYLNKTACKKIRFMPTADVAEVKHGYWIRKDYKPCGHDYICSVCGFGVPLEYKHCPECTAKMDKKVRSELNESDRRTDHME